VTNCDRMANQVWKAEANYEGEEARRDFFAMFKSARKADLLRRQKEELSPRQAYVVRCSRTSILRLSHKHYAPTVRT
jgi:hypothetical protein